MIKDELAAYTADILRRVGHGPAEVLFNGQIGEARRVVGGALRSGQQSPSFSLTNANGASVTLTERLEHGPVVLAFYRGGWCPYCNIALRALQARLPEIKALGGSLIAISPELPDHSLSTSEKLSLDFDVLSDPENGVARQFGLVYRVSDAARDQLLALGRDLVARNGSDAWELPVTATYVIAQDGLIKFDHVDADYRDRLDPVALVNALSR